MFGSRSLFAIAATGLLAAASVFAQTAPTPTPVPEAPPAATPVATPAAVPAAPAVRKMTIIVDDKAQNDGAIHLVFAPSGGAAKDIQITVAAGMKKKDVCRDIAKELKVAVGDGYKVDHYDDDKVKVQGKDKSTFSLTMAGNTVGGLSIRLKAD